MKRFSREQAQDFTKKAKKLCLSVFICGLIIGFSTSFYSLENESETIEKQIDADLYRREEFFGSQAIVPIPTAEAYERLLKLTNEDDPKVFAELAGICEKLEKFDESENYFIKAENLRNLAEFYRRRGNYLKQAETLEQILNKEKRLDDFEILLQTAQTHEIDKYLQPEFFQQVAEMNGDSFPIIEKLVDRLAAENQTLKALQVIRSYKTKFPEKMLEKEVFLLSPKEAESVYYQAFDPFWSDDETGKFYQFLSDNDRLRAYGSELKAKFRQNPADYQTAIRLIHYEQYNYDRITPLVLRLEKAKKSWESAELLTIARFLLKDGNGDLAAKFLYTLQVRNDFTPEMRGKISYQIFKILCDAEYRRLSLTKGDLNFYRDIASTDTHPGITTGILSLIFSDTNPGREFSGKEESATKFFNRAAAYRVFQNYKKEFPSATEIGQMYLDLINIYTKSKETEIAEKLLNEFAETYEKSNDFPRVAMNLADAFVIAEKPDKERWVYQKIMDFLGKEKRFLAANKITKPEGSEYSTDYGDEQEAYTDFLGNRSEQITYDIVLSRYVASLSKSKNVGEILEIYSNEIAKYPEQEWLYEQRLNWLEQTNMFDEQLKAYKTALEKFPTNNWRDKLARWFIRQKRNNDFAEFSRDLVEKLNDSEVEKYLADFIGNDIFNEKLYLKLYQIAHQRFPHNITFVNHLLNFYKSNNRENEWRNLAAEYYFESPQIRMEFLSELAKKGELQTYLNQAKDESVIYELFRADVNLQLSRYEEALQNYRKLNEIYPNNTEFFNHLVNLTRSFGQKERQMLNESANFARKRADFEPSNSVYRTESGEINAESGDYNMAQNEWEKLIETGKGSGETYLETASVFWDYFQYDEALKTIQNYRKKTNDTTIYAFEAGAILESQHKRSEAISEYIKALENNAEKAQKRLKILAKNRDVFSQINTIFQAQKKSDLKTLYYAEILRDLEKTQQANNLLHQQINLSRDMNFLDYARNFSTEMKPVALQRQAEISTSPRKSISYRLRLADFYRENNQPDEAKQVLTSLLQKYPTNYGVLTESADFYWSLGANDASLKVLQNGFEQAKGDYSLVFASRLAKRFISLDRLSEAERILVELHQKNQTDPDIFHELVNVYVRQGKAENLRQILQETIKAIKVQTDLEPKEIGWQIAEMRQKMITAFTKLKDYRSAVEQYIEIINREPDKEDNVEEAISYVKRYGGADLLLNYYQKTAAEAFKNYRWNVVLAKIFEANGDAENAVKNYHKAIDNQPEMTGLYAELVRIETNRKNYLEALNNLDKIIELSGEEKKLIKQKVQLLQLLGRSEEAKAEERKLPAEAKPVVKPENQFSEAEKAKSIEMFRGAFALLMEKPLENELKAENITSYIHTLRQEEELDMISARLFSLREKLLTESQRQDAKLAGEARTRLQTLQNAMSQTIGNLAKTVGTNNELEKIYMDLNQRIDKVSTEERNGTLTFLQDFSTRAGFGDLVEKILIKRGTRQNLIDFYNERGAYQKVLEIAETANDLPLIAENAKLLGNREKELKALRQIFRDKKANQINILRYLQIIDKTELETLARQNSPHQLQLINFLLGKGEKELAHQAIENSEFQKSWKLSRYAEISLALKEFDDESECYFCDALNLAPIGELIKQQPDKTQHLIGNDWFRLARQYGEWLDEKKDPDADKFLPAMSEDLPGNSDEQAKLGEYYLAKNEFEKAGEHFQLSLEFNEENTYVKAKLGEIFWRLGKKQKAEEIFSNVLNEDFVIYLQTLKRIGLQSQAEEKVLPLLAEDVNRVEKTDDLLTKFAAIFDSEKEKADFFLKLCQRTSSENLPQKLIQQDLIAKEFRQPFYEMLIKPNYDNSYGYEFQEISRRTFSNEDAEEIYDHEKNFAEAETERFDKFTYQSAYLENLLESGKILEAKKLILNIEREMKGAFPRPISLRLAHWQMFGGDLDKIIGIKVTDNVKEVKPPSIERLNEAVAMLREAKRDAEAEDLILRFYARMLALEQNETANFIGLARQLFKFRKVDEALQILNIATNFEQEEKQAELLQMPIISPFVPKTVTETGAKNNPSQTEALNAAANICGEFQQTGSALKFRQRLIEISPNDTDNLFRIAELLPEENSASVLQAIIDDRNTPRSIRWKSIWKLHTAGKLNEIPNIRFDAYSQFYNGFLFNDENYFLNSLISDKDVEPQQLQQLIKAYANIDKPFAALRLAEIDKSEKSDELLDLLSKLAERNGEYNRAIEYERAKSNADKLRIKSLVNLEIENNKRAVSFTVDAENTRKL